MQERKLPIERYAAYVIVILGVLLAVRFLLAPVLAAALPFLLAWGAAYLARPIALRLSRSTRMPRGVLAVAVVFLFLAAVCALLFFGARRAIAELLAFGERLGDAGTLQALVARLSAMWGTLCEKLAFLPSNGETEGMLSDWIARVGGALGEWAVGAAGRLLAALPSFFLSLGVALCAAFYFALDLDGIHRTLRELMPKRVRAALTRVKEGAFYAALGYLRAYLILAAITFGALTVGFLLLRVRYAVLLALLFAAFDFLPVVGVNILLIPWAIFELIGGKYFLGFGLLILCGGLALIRQFAEPRIISRRFGIHPLASLAGMYFGLRFFGFWGLLFGPVLAMAAARAAGELGARQNQKPHP